MQLSLDKTAALNISFVGNPVLSNSSIAIAVNGLFTGRNEVSVPRVFQKELEISSACRGLPKMIKVSIHENVFKSASLIYFNDISASCAVEIVGNKIAGKLRLQKFSTYLKWSKIGKLHMHLIQATMNPTLQICQYLQSLMSTALKTVILPYLNFQLKRGLSLPIMNGFAFQNANILYANPWIAACGDVSFLGEYFLNQQAAYVS